jgi:hypothetical protein
MTKDEREQFNDKWWEIKKRFQNKFVRGVGPGWAGTEPTDAESWLEADEEEMLSFIYQELHTALQEQREDFVEALHIFGEYTEDIKGDTKEDYTRVLRQLIAKYSPSDKETE